MSTIASSAAVIALRAARPAVVVVALLLGSLGAAATAHADTTDSHFLVVLKSEGITDHVSTAHAIEAAHTVCQKLDDGQTPSEVAGDVLNSSSMPAYHSGYSSARASTHIARSTTPSSLVTPESAGGWRSGK